MARQLLQDLVPIHRTDFWVHSMVLSDHLNSRQMGFASTLWDDATRKSAPKACTSTGICGTLWHASTRTLAPKLCAHFTISAIGFMHPVALKKQKSFLRILRAQLHAPNSCTCFRRDESEAPSSYSEFKHTLVTISAQPLWNLWVTCLWSDILERT